MEPDIAISAAQLIVQFKAEGVRETAGAVDDVGNKVESTRKRAAAGGLALVGFAAALGGTLALATREAIGFEAQMANVNSIAQLSGAEIGALSDRVLALAGPTAQAPQTLAAGLYDVYSSGFQGAEALTVLETSARAATAGLTTTDVSARAITATLNAFGLGADQAGRVADVLFQTVNEGVITFDQLAVNLGNTLPLASALGVSIEELGAAYAQLTLKGIPAAQAETQIAALMRSTINPTEALTAAVTAQGFASVEAMIAAEGFGGFLAFLATQTGGSTEALFDLLGTTESVNAALVLGAEGGADYAASVERMGQASAGAGALQAALNKQMQSASFQIQRAKVALLQAAVVIGRTFLPAVTLVAKGIASLVGAFLDLPDPVQRMGALIATAAAGFLTLVGVLALVTAGAGPVAAGVGVLGAALGLLLSPIALVVAAVGGLAFLFRDEIGAAIAAASAALLGIVADFRLLVDAGVAPVEAAFFALGLAIDALFGTEIATRLRGWAQAVTGVFVDLLGAVTGFVDTLFAVGFDEAVGVLAANLQAAFGSDALTSAVVNGIQAVKNVFTGEWAAAWADLKDLAVDLGTVAVNVAGWVLGEVEDLWGWVTGQVAGLWEPLKGAAAAALSVVVDVAGWVKGEWPGLWAWVKLQVSNSLASVKDTAAAALDLAIDVAAWVKGAWPDLWAWVKETVADAWAPVAGLPAAALDVTVDIGNWIVRQAAEAPSLLSQITAWVLDNKPGSVDAGAVTVLITPQAAVAPGATGGGGADQAWWRSLWGWFADFRGDVLSALSNPGSTINQGARELGEKIGYGVGATIAGVLGAGASLVAALRSFRVDTSPDMLSGFRFVWEQALAPLINPPLSLLQGFVPSLTDGFNAVLDAVLPQSFRDAIADFELGDQVYDFFAGLGDKFQAGYDYLLGVIEGLTAPKLPDWIADPAGWLLAQIGLAEQQAQVALSRGAASTGEGTRAWPNPAEAQWVAGQGGAAAGMPGGPDVYTLPNVGGAGPLANMAAMAEAAAAVITNATLAIESRVTAMAGVVTTMAFNAGDGFRSGLSQGFQAAGVLVTNATLAMESRLGAFAAAATSWAFDAGDGWAAGINRGWQRAAALVTNATLASEARLAGFAGAATAAAFQAGAGWFAGTSQGFRQAEGAARGHVGSLRGILAVDLSGQGYRTGRSYGDAVAAGLWASLPGVRAAGAAIQGAAVAASNATIAQLNFAAEQTSAFDGTGV